MPVRTLDEIMLAQPGGFATPGTAGIANAMSAGYAQAQQWQMQNPVMLQHMASVGMTQPFPMMATPAQMTPAGLGIFRPPPMPPAPGLRSTAGVTGMFHDPYESRIQSQMMMAQQMMNPTRATDMLARQATAGQAGFAGQVLGGTAGFGMGGFMGASTGMQVGGFLGGMVSDLPVVGTAWNWINKQRLAGAAQLLSGGANLQMGTMGHLQLTGQDVGLGGRGMNQQAAISLTKRLSEIAAKTGGEFNRIDVTNLTTAAAQSGLLDAATNIDQIGTTMEKLVKVMGKMAKLTGDPSFQRNMQEIANLKNFGFTVDQAVRAVGDLGNYAREAGMTRGQLMAGGGRVGMTTFAAAGLAPSVGLMAGGFGAAQARRMQGAVDPTVMALMGGQEGVQQRSVESMAAMMSGVAPTFLGSLMDIEGTGAGAQLRLDPNRIRDFLKFRREGVNIQEIMGRSTARLGELAQQGGISQMELMSQLHMRQPELLSKLGQQMGPEGMQVMLLQVLNALRSQTGSLSLSANMLSGGDPNQAQFLVNLATNTKMMDRTEEALRERIRRAEVQGQQEWYDLRQKKEKDDDLSVRDVYHARRLAREQRERADEAAGISRVYMPEEMARTATGGEWGRLAAGRAQEFVKRRAGRGGRGLGGSIYEKAAAAFGGIAPGIAAATAGLQDPTMDWVTDEERETYLEGMGAGRLSRWFGGLDYSIEQALGTKTTARDIEELKSSFAGLFMRESSPLGRLALMPTDERQAHIKRTLEDWKRGSKSAQKAFTVKPGEYWRSMRKLTTRFGSPLMAAIRKDILQTAINKGRGQGGRFSPSEIMNVVRGRFRDAGFSEAQIKELVSKNEDQWIDFGYATAVESSNPDALQAVGDLEESAMKSIAGIKSVDEANKYLEKMNRDYLEKLGDLGVIESGADAMTPGQEEGIRVYKEASAEERAAMALLGDMSDEGQRQLLELNQTNAAAVESARKKLGKLGTQGREVLANISKQVRRGKAGASLQGLLAGSRAEALVGTDIGAALLMPDEKKRVIEELEKNLGPLSKNLPGGPSGAITPERRAEIQELEEQIKTLREIRQAFVGEEGVAGKLNKASESLIYAGKTLTRDLPVT